MMPGTFISKVTVCTDCLVNNPHQSRNDVSRLVSNLKIVETAVNVGNIKDGGYRNALLLWH